jgi:hypothetical protein
MGIDDVDKQFRRKSTLIVLECRNCGAGNNSVHMTYPRWFNGSVRIALCANCDMLLKPTSTDLLQEQQTVINSYKA